MKTANNKVSIVTPCYNGAKYLDNYFKSILKQTHREIELIFVNDGSTDDTEKIALQYGEELKKNGMEFIYITQENLGQAAAINKGLAVFSGDFFTWMDSDDIMEPDNIKKKLEYLKIHEECGFVMNAIQFVDEKDVEKRIGGARRVITNDQDLLFNDYICGKNVIWVPGTVLVRTALLLNALYNRSIYESREGQNWQIMLPLAYLYKCGYIEEELLKCVCHADSHSRMRRSFKDQVSREQNFIVICTETLLRIRQMSETERQKWNTEIRIVHNKNILNMSIKNHKYLYYYRAKEELLKDGYSLHRKETYLYSVFRSTFLDLKNKIKK